MQIQSDCNQLLIAGKITTANDAHHLYIKAENINLIDKCSVKNRFMI